MRLGRGRKVAFGATVTALICMLTASLGGVALAQAAPAEAPAKTPVYLPVPAFDTSSLDTSVNPCDDFYKYSCGKFAANHPIPADQSGVDQFYELFNVNTQALNGILTKTSAISTGRSANEQKIGDYYKACLNTALIDQKNLAPIEPLLKEIDGLGDGVRGKMALASLIGKLQRMSVDVFFGFGEQQDFKDASKQIASISQGGLGMPEKDYYLRTGEKDVKLREQYVEHVAKMLELAGSSPEQSKKDADAIMVFETALAKASMSVTEMRDPEKIYHLQPISTFEATIPGVKFSEFLAEVHSPSLSEINNSTPEYFPVLVKEVKAADMETLKAYMRYHLLSTFANRLPKRFDEENFHFFGSILNGQPQQQPRWKRCSNAVNGAMGEALGQVYVDQYFAGDSKAKMLEMVHDIEDAMDLDIDHLDWMSDTTKMKAKEKLHLVANKIGYPDKWRDYSKLVIEPEDALGNQERANEFENDRQLRKIGQPVDHSEWGMTPPTVNAYYDPSMNDINFPAGILQPSFYDPKANDAVNYGHIGAVIGHELTHGFDDEGRKFDGHGNLSNWWTPEDIKQFETKTDCLVNEYGGFTAVDDVKVNGKLTLGENTADNGGLVLAYMAYLERAKKNNVDLSTKQDGYTKQQQFYIAFAQNWCENARPEQVRAQVLTDPHSPDHFRANGAIVNAPGFAEAFGCKKGSPMVPANSCRVW
ncbi:M13 family metallopeptidase [Granulicella arctica]|uniref:Endothelin-converting enzyme/putative endopeptidase n=1 Tax=Granulicella arctica TaxID=940613 RepID=A0A7Y9TIY1_9BACT|nr:M13 family metallopeptidase [Granulicella arctica]NYF77727.1 endothelin-converting enzyme/putative endopeptidase [Granulicella arctica]